MRRGLLALPDLADVQQRLCAECGLPGRQGRLRGAVASGQWAVHARAGERARRPHLTPAELAGLGDEDSDGGC